MGTDQVSLNLPVTNELHFELEKERRKSISELTARYFFETNPEKKAKLHKKIDEFILQYIDYNIELYHEGVENQLTIRKAEIKSRQKIDAKYKPSKKEQRTLADLESQLELYKKRKQKLHELEFKPERPFFLWHLFFQDILEKEGFDIVIANPPYVRHEAIKEIKTALQKEGYKCYTGTADLFVYFYERSISLLKENGILTYITSNKYYRSNYGKKLREFLVGKLQIFQMIDFGDAPVFDAIAYASIIIGQKIKDIDKEHAVRSYTWQPDDHISKLVPVMRDKSFPVKQIELKPEGWRLESPEVMRLLEKLQNAGTPLGDYVKGRFYRGIVTGLNEAFVIDRETRDGLVAEDPKSEELLKPFLRGKDVKRWRVDDNDIWLIYVPWHFPLHLDKTVKGISTEVEKLFKHKYPAIYKYLFRFKKQLKARNKAETGIRYEWYALQRWGAEYWQEYNNAKIVWGNLSKEPKFSFAKENVFINAPACMIISSCSFLLAILNSKISQYMVSQSAASRQGGFLEYKPMYVANIPIPINPQDGIIESFVEKMNIFLVKNEFKNVEIVEKKINQYVYNLFDLNEKEIEIIESETR